jgi:hypothetical protein
MASQGPGAGAMPPVAKKVNPADIVFCVDCTESMAPCFEGLLQNLHLFVEGLQTANQVDFRLRLIEYRDLNEGEQTVAGDFTVDAAEFRRQLHALKYSGGGDIPESTFDAIYTALNSPWRPSCHKAVLIFTDAPSHPQLHETTVPPGVPADIETVINLLAAKGVWLYLVAVEDPLYERLANREKVFLQLYPADDARYEGLAQVNFAQVLDNFGRSISQTSGII